MSFLLIFGKKPKPLRPAINLDAIVPFGGVIASSLTAMG